MQIDHQIEKQEIHKITDCKAPEKRFADVHFTDGKFTKCTFRTSAPVYTLDDWDFINQVSSKILQLATR